MPVKYGDLGKKGDDLFNKGFEHGKHKVEVTHKSSDGKVELTTKGHLSANGSISSSHETKFNCSKGGSLKIGFDHSKNAVDCDYENGKLIKNGKINALFSVGLGGCPMPNFGKLKFNYNHEKVNVNLDSNLSNNLNLDLVAAVCSNTSLGAKLGMDLKSMSLTNRQVAFQANYGSVDYVVRSGLQNDFNALIHNTISNKTSVATSVTFNASGTSIGLAAKMAGCCGSSNQFKVANNGRFTLSHITPLRLDGATLTVSGDFDATNLSSGSHKLGAGLKFAL